MFQYNGKLWPWAWERESFFFRKKKMWTKRTTERNIQNPVSLSLPNNALWAVPIRARNTSYLICPKLSSVWRMAKCYKTVLVENVWISSWWWASKPIIYVNQWCKFVNANEESTANLSKANHKNDSNQI